MHRKITYALIAVFAIAICSVAYAQERQCELPATLRCSRWDQTWKSITFKNETEALAWINEKADQVPDILNDVFVEDFKVVKWTTTSIIILYNEQECSSKEFIDSRGSCVNQ